MPQNKIERFIPNLTGLVDPRAEIKFNQTFVRMYEYLDAKILQLQQELTERIKQLDLSKDDINSLIGVFSQPLAGTNQTDPLLQGLIQNFGAQLANSVFAGPTPSFRLLTPADIPNLSAAKITTGNFSLARLDTKVLQTQDNLNKTLGSPVPDGTITIFDNNGHSIKVITTT